MISAVVTFDDDRITIHSSKTKNVDTIFSSGFYQVTTDNNGNMHINQENLQELHNPYKTKENILIMNTMENFFAPGIWQKVKVLGFTHKLGILLHGKPGTGKTSMLHFIAKKLIEEQEAIVFICNNSNNLHSSISLGKMVREIQDNPIIFIADEFDLYAKEAEGEMKNFLDGNLSIDNMLFLGATNYIDKIPDTLKNRPSRFKVVLEIRGITDKSLMTTILSDISGKISPSLFTSEEIEELVEHTEDATMDDLKHLCLNKVTDSYLPKQLVREPIGFSRTSEEEIKKFMNLKESLDKTVASARAFAIKNKETTMNLKGVIYPPKNNEDPQVEWLNNIEDIMESKDSNI